MNSKGTFIGRTCLSILLLLLAVGVATAGHNHSKIAYPFSETQIPLQISEAGRGSVEIMPGTKAVGDPVDMDAALIAGANYLRHAQADVTEDNAGNGDPDADLEDGGWDWRLTAPNFIHSSSSSSTNLYGVTARGLYYAYLETADASYMTAMQDAATQMIGVSNIWSAGDLIFLMLFQDLPGVTPDIYSDAAKTKFDARIEPYGSATAWAEYIGDFRAGQGNENGIIPWDIGAWVVAAQMLEDRYPSDPYDYAQAADDMAEVIYQDSYEQAPGYFDLTTDKNNGWDPTYSNRDYYWYTLGITGILDAFESANLHTDSIPSLLTILLDCQYSGGAFSYCYGANTDDEDWQSTAYAVMTLARVDQSTYQTNINHACYWVGATQDPDSGGWVYSSGNHYPEVGGECTGALYYGENASEVWVDDDYCDTCYNDGHLWGYDAFATIQNGIDGVGGSTVNVAAGTYEEQVVIDKTLTLVGAGSKSGLSTSTIIKSPVSLTYYFTTGSNDNYPVVGIHDAIDVIIRDCQIDGASRGNSNYRFCGIAFWNAGGSIIDCYVTGVRDDPFSGAQHGIGIYSYNNTGGPYTINVTGTDVDDFQKNGVALSGDGLTVNVTGCTVTGHGPTDVTAQNGIQISWGAGGTVTDCSVSGIAYTGEGWIASGMLFYLGTTVDLSGVSSVSNSQANIVFQGTNGSVDGAVVTTSGVNNEEGVSIRDYGYSKGPGGKISFVPVSPLEEELYEEPGQKGAPTTVTLSNLNLTGAHEPSSYGIAAWSIGDNVTVSVTQSNIQDWEIGIVAYEDGSVVDVTATSNNISSNDMGFWTNAASLQNATGNWWGDTSGPLHTTTNSDATGDEVSDNVDYSPWWGADYVDDPHTSPWTWYVNNSNNSTIQEGIDAASPSDVVGVKNGSYGADPATGKCAYITKDGLSLIGESETGTIIDGAIGGVGSSSSYWPKGIHVQANNVTVQNFTVQGFTGDLSSTGGYGVLHRDYAHDTEGEGWIFYDGCTVDNVTVQNSYSVVYALCFTHLTVLNCNLNNNFSDGMFIARGSDYATIHDNIVTNSGDHGIWVGNCWMGLRPSHNAIIYNNTVNGAREGGISFVGSDNAVIYHNSITNAAGDGWSVGALSLKDGPTNVEAHHNHIYNNSGTWGGYNGTGHGVGIDGAASNIDLHHNSIYGNSGLGVYNGSSKGLVGSWERRLSENGNLSNPNRLIQLDGNEGSKAFVMAEYNYWGSVDGPEDLVGSDEAKLDECYDVSTMKNAVAEISGSLGNGASEDVDYCPWLGGDAGFDAEIYAGCNDPCDDFCLDFKLTGTDVRFFHFEYPLPDCIDFVSSSASSVPGLENFLVTMFGSDLHIDGNFDSPNFTGANVKIGEICFTHDGTCPNDVQTLTCTADEVLDGGGNTVDVSPGLAIINVDNTAPTKDHPTGNILPCYSASDDPDWSCWNLSFYKGAQEWQCDLLQATIRIYSATGCNPGDLVFTHDFFTTTIPGDFTICYPTDQADRDAIWSALSGDGTYYVRLTVKDDCCNEADNCDAFTFCTDTYTDNYMTCLDARPAHNHICLEWNYDFDATNAVKLRILRSPYRAGNYPVYAASDPVPTGYNDPNWYVLYEGTDTYPCDQLTWYNDDGEDCNGSGTFFDNTTRDIYWYAGFTLDAAGNWSDPDMTVGDGADRATSYWLGDVTDAWGPANPPDGYVWGFTGDLHRLTAVYGTSPAGDPAVDYGPETEDHGIGRGIPIPDDVINYKDLKPFSYNWNIVGPSGDCDTWPLLHEDPPRNLKAKIQEVAVWLEQVGSNHHDGITFALMLTNPDDATHLFHSRISFNTTALSLIEVRRGEVGITEGSAEFFAAPTFEDGLVDVDLAALGPDGYLVGSGAVAYLDFSYKTGGMSSEIWLKEAILYDGEGNEINLSPTGVEVENQGEAIPTEFALHHNHPNPFNPTTIIKYDLPKAAYVKLVVYNVMGQKVTTLIDGMVEAGRHQVVWNAKDISSGIYFYKITAGNFTNMRKMILLK